MAVKAQATNPSSLRISTSASAANPVMSGALQTQTAVPSTSTTAPQTSASASKDFNSPVTLAGDPNGFKITIGVEPIITAQDKAKEREAIRQAVRFAEVPKIKVEVRKNMANQVVSMFKSFIKDEVGEENAQYLMEIVKSKWDTSPQKRKADELEDAEVEAVKKARNTGHKA